MTEPTITPRQPPKRHVLRTARRLMLLAALAAAVAAASFVLVRKQPATSHAPATILKTAAVTSGNLTTTEKIDGSLVLSDTLNVLHRIEGQVSSAAPNASATGAPSAAAGGSLGSSASGLVAAGIGATITDIADITDITGAGGAGGVRGLGAGPAAVPPPGCPGGSSDQTTTTTAPPDTPPAGTSVPAATCPGTVDTTVASPTPSSTPDATSTTTGRDGADTTVPAGGLPPGSPGDTSTTTAGAGGPAGGAGGGARSGAAGGGGTGGTSSGGGTGGSGATSAARITQTITSIIGVGATVGLGDVLYTVDSRPVVALSGALPAWRTLSSSSDDGPDVQQLESSLVSLGYDPTGTVTVDDNFDSHTKAMVERWQVGLGVDSTGTVDLGSVVFLPTTTTVSTAAAAVGDAVGDGDTIVTLTAATQQVVIDVPDGDEAFIVPGLEVQLGSAAATVALLRSIERNGAVVVQAVIVPAAPIDGVANGATVKVTITTDNVDGVMVVPANALLSHLDGTYAVQVQAADGTVSWHTVELLGVSGNQVGIRGDGIVAGTLVLVPV